MGKNRLKRLFDEKGLSKRIKKNQGKVKGRNSAIFPDNLKTSIWKPSDGKHIIDIIPYIAGNKDPNAENGSPVYTYEYLMHPNVGPNNKQVICPTMFNKKCPICEYRNELRDNGDDAYKSFFPKTRNIYNVICYDDKKERKLGIQIWDVAYFYFEKHLMSISKIPSRSGKEEKTINFCHPVKGKSITFEIEKPKSKDDFPKYIGHSFYDRDYRIDDKILEKTQTIDEIVIALSYEEIKEQFYIGIDSKSKERRKSENDDDEENTNFENLLEEIEDLEDIDELEEFVDDNDLEESDFSADGKFKKEKKKVIKYIEKQIKEEEKREDHLSREEIEDMSYKELKKLIKKENLEINIKDFDKDDDEEMEDLVDEICEELEIE